MNFIPFGMAPGWAAVITARARRLRSLALVVFCRRFMRRKLALRTSPGQRATGRMARLRLEHDRRSIIAEWRAISLSARLVNSRPGGILCHGDAPEGCGNGIKSKHRPARSTRNLWPITFSSFAQSMNCTMASRPTGMIRRGCKIRISLSIHDEQSRISSGAGTRSVPPEFFPGKQRQTAAK